MRGPGQGGGAWPRAAASPGPGTRLALCPRPEAGFPDSSLPLDSRGCPSPPNRSGSLLNGKCLVSIWALTKWNFPSAMEVTSAHGQALRLLSCQRLGRRRLAARPRLDTRAPTPPGPEAAVSQPWTTWPLPRPCSPCHGACPPRRPRPGPVPTRSAGWGPPSPHPLWRRSTNRPLGSELTPPRAGPGPCLRPIGRTNEASSPNKSSQAARGAGPGAPGSGGLRVQVGGPSRVQGAPAQPQAGWLQAGDPSQASEGRATLYHQMSVTEAPGMVLSSTADGRA